MNFSPFKSIIVVAPDKCAKVARSIVHYISKNFAAKGFDASYWTLKHFEGNECQLAGSQKIIFIGDESENKYSSHYLPHLKLNNNHGICYGYDGSKAVVYGEGKLEQAADLKKEVQKIDEYKPLEKVMFYVFLYVSAVPLFGYILINDAIVKKKLKNEQTQAAAYSFCQNELERWMNE